MDDHLKLLLMDVLMYFCIVVAIVEGRAADE